MRFATGTRLGAFEVTSLIGEGGMGEVYRARDTSLQRDVALKVLPESFLADPERLARIKREAQTLAALNHPHIAQIHGLEESSQGIALVMELVDGDDLAARLTRGPMPLDEALAIARQIAEALEAAHDRGIVHRDLKPANVKVTPDGAVKVLDFGLAKAIDRLEGDGFSRRQAEAEASALQTITSPAMTMRGVILGTAAYMAPEQAKGKVVDRRADIWALGCVLYELLTGTRAFDGEDVTEILGSVVKTDPDWTKLPSQTPATIKTLLKRCLQKNPKQRLDSAAAVRLEIVDAITAPLAAASPQAMNQSNSRLAWAVAAVFALIAAGIGAAALRPVAPAPMMRLEIPTPPSSLPASFAISPDGQWVAFVGGATGRESLWVRSLEASAARELPGTDNPVGPFWSPDSRSVGYFAAQSLNRIDVSGGLAQKIASAPNGRGGSWNRDGTIVFASTPGTGLSRVSASGGDVTPITKLDANEVSHRLPAFLPDGNHFLYLVAKSGRFWIRLGSLDQTVSRDLFEMENNQSGADYHPSGFLLFAHAGGIYGQPFDASRLSLTGERFLAIQNDSGTTLANRVSIADTGTVLYRSNAVQTGISRLAWRDLRGARLPPEFDAEGREPEISPDGRRAAVVRATGINNDIWLVDLVRGIGSRFTSDDGLELWPAWSRDNGSVVFGKVGIHRQSLSGQRVALLTHVKLNQPYPLQWSPDGRYLLFRSLGDQTQNDLWAAMDDGKSQVQVAVSRFNETRGQFSPDGKWISYESDESGQMEIYIRPFNRDGAATRVSVSGGSEARWHPSGNAVFFIGTGSRMMTAAVKPDPSGAMLVAEPPKELFVTSVLRGGLQAPNFKFQYDVAPDGKRLLINEAMSTGDAGPSPLIVTLNWRPPG